MRKGGKQMAISDNGGGRARAWVLLQVKSPHDAAHALYEQLKDEGDDSYVVIRADVVDYEHNIVVPVDAENDDVLETVYGTIKEITGASRAVLVRVVEHIPFPPHDAQGYITQEEADAGEAPGIEPGRQSYSPGENAWG
jgi:hypothetical protein